MEPVHPVPATPRKPKNVRALAITAALVVVALVAALIAAVVVSNRQAEPMCPSQDAEVATSDHIECVSTNNAGPQFAVDLNVPGPDASHATMQIERYGKIQGDASKFNIKATLSGVPRDAEIGYVFVAADGVYMNNFTAVPASTNAKHRIVLVSGGSTIHYVLLRPGTLAALSRSQDESGVVYIGPAIPPGMSQVKMSRPLPVVDPVN